MARIDFWFDFASTYSCLAAMRIDGVAASAAVGVRWRPFLLGPIFAAQGWTTSPFNLFPARGDYMWRDLERQGEAMGLAIRRPDPFPQNGLLAARVGLIADAGGWAPEFARAVFTAEFTDLRQISDPEVVSDLLGALGRDSRDVFHAALSDANKARLRDETAEARRLGIFGAPTFVAEDGELFWGNDRLEEALHWARRGTLGGR